MSKVSKEVTLDLEEIETEPEVEVIQKPKRTLTDKQREAVAINLAKGRAVRDAKRDVKREEDKKKAEELVMKKAEKLKKNQNNKTKQLKKVIYAEDDDDEVEVEERIIKKPKKKKIIYREESDSEEEVIVRRQPKKELPAPKAPEQVIPQPIQFPSIRFV